MNKIKYSLSASYNVLLAGICIAGLFFFSSCNPTRHYTYLKTIQADTTIRNFVSNDFESKIRSGDQLAIKVTSLSTAEDEQFNKAGTASTTEGMSGFGVDPEGFVQLHRLGKVQVAGFTRRELAAKLEKDLVDYMKEPIVNVQYINHKVTVIGAVTKPGVINMPEEQLNIFEVLVKSGDIRATGMKNRVMVIREENNDKKVKLVDLEDHKIFTSPWYYIKPNDILVVNDDTKTLEKAERRNELRTTLSLVASGISLVIIVIDRVFR